MTVTGRVGGHSKTSSHTKQRTVLLAEVVGYCFGVRRAVEMTERAATERAGRVTSLGPLIHNAQVTDRLKASGIESAAHLDEIASGTVVLSAHGSAPIVLRQARDRGLEIVDGTCPFVTRVHRAAKSLVENGYRVLLVGDPGHTEVIGVVAAIEEMGGWVRRVSSPEQVAALHLGGKVGVLSQTTQRRETFAAIVAEVCKLVSDVRAVNTVCGATEELQAAAIRLARQVDLVIVIGGRQSANTRRLRELCEEQGVVARQVETADDIDQAWLERSDVVGITAGASTPDWLIEEVARAVNGGSLPEGWRINHPDEG